MEPKNIDGKANDKSASGITMDAKEVRQQKRPREKKWEHTIVSSKFKENFAKTPLYHLCNLPSSVLTSGEGHYGRRVR